MRGRLIPAAFFLTFILGTANAQDDVVAKIKDEGLNRSQVMQTLSYLTDVIGPRLTGSPNLKKATAWTLDRLKQMGLSNVRTESWGEFGMGWQQRHISLRMITPATATTQTMRPAIANQRICCRSSGPARR